MKKNMYREAMDKGKVLIKKTFWKNNTFFVQFIQLVERNDESLFSLQGYNKVIITTLTPFKENKLDLKEDYDYMTNDEIVFAGDIYGFEVNIGVIENTKPYNERQLPRKSKATGNYLKYNRELVYRHTKLIKGKANRAFLEYDLNFK